MARERSGPSECDSGNTRPSDRTRAESLLGRRSYLKAAGIAAGVMAAGAGAAGAAADDADVNVVEAGADDTGSTPINDVLDEVHEDGATIYFPPGEYLLHAFRTSADDWTWIGEDATIVVPGSENRRYLHFDGDGWTVDGFTIDLTASGAAPINHLRGDDWVFRNVVFEGQMGDQQYRSGSNLLYPNVDSSGATGVIESVIAADGSADPDESSNRGALWTGPNSEGHLVIRNSHFRHFANNTLYVANVTGPVTIEGCLIEDSNVGVRIGGNTVVRNTVFDQRGPVPRSRWSGGRAARGIWINSNSYVAGDIEIEGCDFLMNGPQGSRAVFSANRLDGIEIRDCRIHQNERFTGIEFDDGGSGRTVIENTSLVGDAEKAAVRLVGRDGARLRNVCVQQPGTGVELQGSNDVVVEDSTVNVSGEQFAGATPSTSNVTASDSCPAPSNDWNRNDDETSEPDDEADQPDDETDDEKSDETDDSDGKPDETDGENDDAGDVLPPNRVSFVGTGTPTTYTFTATGDVVENPDRGSVESCDVIDGSTVTGRVTEDVDSYRFEGRLTALSFRCGEATVVVNGVEIDPARI